MKIVKFGTEIDIFNNDLLTFDELPVGTYNIKFDPMKGFSLETRPNIKVNERKIYGDHLNKIPKVFNSFKLFNRSLGVLLSGDKGIGKTLFAQLLCSNAIKNNIPVIIVDTYYNGIGSFLNSITTECLVLFDEFDKIFSDINRNRRNDEENNESDRQTNLLSLFDGISAGKKLFVLTCNRTNDISQYLINRPGRMHYHFRFKYPSSSEIRHYLEDNINKKQYGQIDNVIKFSYKIKLNYDCLRAIAFEIKQGEKFEEFINDLNIINTSSNWYNILINYTDGTYDILFRNIDIFSSKDQTLSYWAMNNTSCRRDIKLEFSFNPKNLDYNNNGELILTQKNINKFVNKGTEDEEYIPPKDIKKLIKNIIIKKEEQHLYTFDTI